MHVRFFFVVLLATIICTLSFIDALREKENVHGKGKVNSTIKKNPSRFKGYFLLISLLGVTLAGIFIYYLFICHPILCRKERNYDVVEHSRDTTPTRNIEKTP